MAVKGRWWLRPSKAVWCREPIGVSRAMRRWGGVIRDRDRDQQEVVKVD